MTSSSSSGPRSPSGSPAACGRRPHTRITAAVVQGVLERDGSRLVCRVTSLELKPGDLERLKAAVDQLGARDVRDAAGLGAVGRAPRRRNSRTTL